MALIARNCQVRASESNHSVYGSQFLRPFCLRLKDEPLAIATHNFAPPSSRPPSFVVSPAKCLPKFQDLERRHNNSAITIYISVLYSPLFNQPAQFKPAKYFRVSLNDRLRNSIFQPVPGFFYSFHTSAQNRCQPALNRLGPRLLGFFFSIVSLWLRLPPMSFSAMNGSRRVGRRGS